VQEAFEARRIEIILGDVQDVAGRAAFDAFGPERLS
jgi:hypothetical protein